MNRLVRWAALSATLLLGGCHTPSMMRFVAPAVPSENAPKPTISWEVQNRFRLLQGESEEKRFYRDLSAFTLEYDVWFRREDDRLRAFNYIGTDLIHPPALDPDSRSPVRKDYRVNYDVRTHSYQLAKRGETNWISDPNRTVILKALNMNASSCVWTIAGKAQVPTPCTAPLSRTFEVDQPVDVSVRPAAGGTEVPELVIVRDVKIVAIGDSFSAGEGNPHTQWRFSERRPASWLDPRCHRSLLSGPSLAAAYLARGNPHLSVTLLHYGCSGASISDGVAAPWSLLETAQRSNRRWIDRGYDVAEIPTSQVAASLGPYDIAPSQIEMAVRDLTFQGNYTKPDLILVSVGGNDVGFGKIVTGLAWRWPSAVDGDLHANPTADARQVITFDDEDWKIFDRVCKKEEGVSEGTECLSQRERARVKGMLADEDHPEQLAGFDRVARELERLRAPEKAVYLTQYPNFVVRAPGGSGEPAATFEGPLAGCNDTPFDGRPNLVPSVLALVPGLGLRGEDAREAEGGFLKPLNAALESASQEHGWNIVKEHVARDRGHGFCAFRRYFNTMVDSHWNQGRTYQGSRPMGNIVVKADATLPVKRFIWDYTENCFRESPKPGKTLEDLATGSCVRDEDGQVPLRYVLERKLGRNGHAFDQGGVADSTGAVHPNLFGHCSYAAAIVGKMVEVDDRGRFRDALSSDFKTTASNADFNAEKLCHPRAWGYVDSRDPHQESAGRSRGL